MRPQDAVREGVRRLAGEPVHRPERPITDADVMAELRRTPNGELARELGYEPGTAGYRSTMKTLWAWSSGRQKPGRSMKWAPTEDVLRQRIEARRERSRRRREREDRRRFQRTLERIRREGVRIDYSGGVRVSDDERYRAPGWQDATPGPLLDLFAQAADEGRWGAAADGLANAWGFAYGVGYVAWFDSDGLELGW